MAPRDHKKPDLAKENENDLIHGQNLHANIKQNIPTLNLGSTEPLKPVVNLSDSKTEWANQLKTPSEKKSTSEKVDLSIEVDLNPQKEKVVLQYEEVFPALGAEPEAVNTDVEFTPELLAPETILTAKVLDEQGVTSSGISTHFENEGIKMQISRDIAHDLVHEAILHTLETEGLNQDDLNDDVLEQRAHQFISAEKLKPTNLNEGSLSKSREEKNVKIFTLSLPATAFVAPTDEKTIAYENQFPALGEESAATTDEKFDTKVLSPKHIAKLAEAAEVDAPINPIPYLTHHKQPEATIVHQVTNPPSMGEWEQGSLPKTTAKKAHEYSAQFPALGEEAEIKPVAHQTINPYLNSEILSPQIISKMAEEVVEEAPENPIPYLAHEKLVGPLDKSIHKEAPQQSVGDWAKGSLPKKEELSGSWTVLRGASPERSHEGYQTLNSTNNPNDETQGLLTHADSEKDILPASKTSLSTSAGTLNDFEANERASFYREIELNLAKAKELENASMYGAAINVLKKNVSSLQSFMAKHTYNKQVTDTFLVMCNTELSHLYTIVGEYALANSFSQAALDIDHSNPRVIYLLGTGLIKAGHSAEGYNILLEGTKFNKALIRDPYFDLIDQELAKFELRTDVRTGHFKPDVMIPIRGAAEDIERKLLGQAKGGMTSASAAGVFFGTGVASGLATWFLGKEYYRIPEKKGLAYSVGIGALVGGVSLFLYSHFRKPKVGK